MTLQELEAQLLSLTPAEKLEAIQIFSHSLSQNWRGITKTPGICGASFLLRQKHDVKKIG